MVARAEIQMFADELARRFRPDRIILFGSHAHGIPTTDSDVDLLVVMRHEGDVVDAATEIRTSISREFPLDILVRDPDILQSRIHNNDWFLRGIIEQGVVLYEAADSRMD